MPWTDTISLKVHGKNSRLAVLEGELDDTPNE